MRRLTLLLLLLSCAVVGRAQSPYAFPQGQGGSTLTCIDVDGDTFGMGPTCAGPDADDQDPAVHTTLQATNKWTTIKGLLNHRGYTPTRYWVISPTGNDSTCLPH